MSKKAVKQVAETVPVLKTEDKLFAKLKSGEIALKVFTDEEAKEHEAQIFTKQWEEAENEIAAMTQTQRAQNKNLISALRETVINDFHRKLSLGGSVAEINEALKFLTSNLDKHESLYRDIERRLEESAQQFEEQGQQLIEVKKELEKAKKARNKSKKNPDLQFKMGIHMANQMYNPGANARTGRQLKAWSEDTVGNFFAQSGGSQPTDNITGWGMDLNVRESRVFEAVLKELTATNYQGHKQISKEAAAAKYKFNPSNAAYREINRMPQLTLTPSQLLTLAGYNSRSKWDKNEVAAAVETLRTKQYAFHWDRLVRDEKGNPKKDKSGAYTKRYVEDISILLRIKIITNASGQIESYEIELPAVALDQVTDSYGGNYFLLIPGTWRDEIKQFTGKPPSKSILQFLMWLRLRYEQIRGSKYPAVKSYEIKKTWEEIAEILRMPESVAKGQRKRAEAIIRDCYKVAKGLGYLTDYEVTTEVDTLRLNETFYHNPEAKELTPAKKKGLKSPKVKK